MLMERGHDPLLRLTRVLQAIIALRRQLQLPIALPVVRPVLACNNPLPRANPMSSKRGSVTISGLWPGKPSIMISAVCRVRSSGEQNHYPRAAVLLAEKIPRRLSLPNASWLSQNPGRLP